MKLYIDIETLPTTDPEIIAEIAAGVTPPGNMTKAETIAKWEQEKKPAVIGEAIDKTALGPVVPPFTAFGRVLMIGMALNDDEPMVLRADTEAREAEVISALGAMLTDIAENQRDLLVIGHNVRDFDLRFLMQRAAILGIDTPFKIGNRLDVFDTMLAWTGHPTRHVSLDTLCRAFKIPTKGETDGISGADVARLYRAGEIDRIAEYCRHDVERTRAVYKRMTFQ